MIFCLAGQEGGDDQLIKMTYLFVVYKVLLQTHFLRETLRGGKSRVLFYKYGNTSNHKATIRLLSGIQSDANLNL